MDAAHTLYFVGRRSYTLLCWTPLILYFVGRRSYFTLLDAAHTLLCWTPLILYFVGRRCRNRRRLFMIGAAAGTEHASLWPRTTIMNKMEASVIILDSTRVLHPSPTGHIVGPEGKHITYGAWGLKENTSQIATFDASLKRGSVAITYDLLTKRSSVGL